MNDLGYLDNDPEKLKKGLTEALTPTLNEIAKAMGGCGGRLALGTATRQAFSVDFDRYDDAGNRFKFTVKLSCDAVFTPKG